MGDYAELEKALKSLRETVMDCGWHNHRDTCTQAADTIAALTREREYWERARNEWEKSCRILQEENKKLTRDLDAAIARAEAAETATFNAVANCAIYRRERDALRARAESAERKLEMAVEALKFYANKDIYKPHPHGLGFDDRDKSFEAKNTLAELEKADD
jgi:hypothetical protein